MTLCQLLGTKCIRSTRVGVSALPGRDRLIGAMTATDEVSTALPDLRAVRLDEMPALPTAALDQVVRRVLRSSPTAPELGTAFGSSI